MHQIPVGELDATNQDLRDLLGLGDRPLSRTTLLGLLAAKEALQTASLTQEETGRAALISVGGMDITTSFFETEKHARARMRLVAEHDPASSTEAIARLLGIGGARTTISTACSSGANAIMLGARLIGLGLADTVVAGGTDALSDYTLCGFKSLMILSDTPCRPLSQERDGLNLGEGAAYFVLRRRGSGPRQATLLGWANANDAHHQTAPHPQGDGAARAIMQAIEMARLTPADIDHANLHGTATPGNDTSELQAMRAVFADTMPTITSTKAYTGHTLAAAGAIEAAFSAMSVREQMEWPTLRAGTPIDGEDTRPVMQPTRRRLRTVLSTSLGFGGSSTALIIGK